MSEATGLRIAIVDPQPLFRAGLAFELSKDTSVAIVSESNADVHIVMTAARQVPDIVLIDFGGQSATEQVGSISRLKHDFPRLKIVLLASSEKEECASAAMKAGAHGYILKDVAAAELVRALRVIQTGQVYVSARLGAKLLLQSLQQPLKPAAELADLSHREVQILARAAQGLTNKEIARIFQISEKTVKYYMTSIMKKLNVRNRVEAVINARARGLMKGVSIPA